MQFNIKDLYTPEQIVGPSARVFSEIIVGGDKGGPDSIFIYLEGTYMENQEKMLRARRDGCEAFVASHFPQELASDPNVSLITAEQPADELNRLAALIRSLSPAQIIGVTGSSGKTTTKDMIAHILRQKYKKTLKTFRNYNGALGVALTLRKLREDDEFAVVEIGLGAPGSVAKGAELAKPHVGVITNIGVSHIAAHGSRANIAREKGSLLDHVSNLAVINGDDSRCSHLRRDFSGNVISYGFKRCNELRAEAVTHTMEGLSCHVRHGTRRQLFELPVVGAFQAYNLLAALAVGLHYGFELEEMAERLKAFAPGEQRLKTLKIKDFHLLDDGYNSNPHALHSSLDALLALPLPKNQKIAVIGDMQDLGRFSKMYYNRLHKKLLGAGIGRILLIGPVIKELARNLPGATVVNTVGEAANSVLNSVVPGSVVLLKGQDDPLFKAIRETIMELA